MVFIWIAVVDIGGLIIFAFIYGFFSGAILSLPTIVVVSLSPSLSVVGTRLGTSFAVASLGLLIGTPASGAILRDTEQYVGLQVFAGTMLMMSTALTCTARYYKAGLRVGVKA